MNILIVEDNKLTSDALATLIHNAGHEAHHAFNGINALTHIEIEKPDAIVADLYMPGMGGAELIQKLAANPEWSDIPILIISAAAREDLRVPNGVMVMQKPFEIQNILDWIDTLKKEK